MYVRQLKVEDGSKKLVAHAVVIVGTLSQESMVQFPVVIFTH